MITNKDEVVMGTSRCGYLPCNASRRTFLGGIAGLGATMAIGGSGCASLFGTGRYAKSALQLYSIRSYIVGKKGNEDKAGGVVGGVGVEKAFEEVAKIGYKGVEFAGYYGKTAKELKKLLDDNGLKACGTHVGCNAYGLDTKTWKYNPDVLKETCEFNLGYGNDLIINPGGGNRPEGCDWKAGHNGTHVTLTVAQEDFVKKLCEYYNKIAADAAKFGCRIGLHNHMWEHGLMFRDGTSYWDYFFGHTDKEVCMEQDVGWTTATKTDPCVQYTKFPHRSPTLHAKENGYGDKKFDAILGKPGSGVAGVPWDKLIAASEKDRVEWYVVECECHQDSLFAVKPSYDFLASKGIF